MLCSKDRKSILNRFAFDNILDNVDLNDMKLHKSNASARRLFLFQHEILVLKDMENPME